MEGEVLDIALLLSEIKELGGRYLFWEFSGCGDSGDIEGFTLVKKEFYDWEDKEFSEPTWSDSFKQAHDQLNNLMDYSKVYELLSAFAVNYEEYDWWNNDGGSGDGVLDLETAQYHVNYELRYTKYSSEVGGGKGKIPTA